MTGEVDLRQQWQINNREHMCYSAETLRILAIDPSRFVLGVCRLWGDLGDITFRTETVRLRSTGAERLAQASLWLRDLLASEAPSLTLLRGADMRSRDNGSAAAEMIGVLRLLLLEANEKSLVVPLSSIRLWACGSAEAPPDDVAFAAIRRFGALVASGDQCEAAWLAEIGYYLRAGLEGSTPARRQVLRELRAQHADLDTIGDPDDEYLMRTNALIALLGDRSWD
jgi:hypothetical protein